MNGAFVAIEVRLGFDNVEGRLQRLRVRSALLSLKETSSQPALEDLRPNLPGFAMPVDVNISEGLVGGRMKQRSLLCQLEEDVGLFGLLRLLRRLGYGFGN